MQKQTSVLLYCMCYLFLMLCLSRREAMINYMHHFANRIIIEYVLLYCIVVLPSFLSWDMMIPSCAQFHVDSFPQSQNRIPLHFFPNLKFNLQYNHSSPCILLRHLFNLGPPLRNCLLLFLHFLLMLEIIHSALIIKIQIIVLHIHLQYILSKPLHCHIPMPATVFMYKGSWKMGKTSCALRLER